MNAKVTVFVWSIYSKRYVLKALSSFISVKGSEENNRLCCSFVMETVLTMSFPSDSPGLRQSFSVTLWSEITTPGRTALLCSSLMTQYSWMLSGTPCSYSLLQQLCMVITLSQIGGMSCVVLCAFCDWLPVFWWTVSSILNLLSGCFWSVWITSHLHGTNTCGTKPPDNRNRVM